MTVAPLGTSRTTTEFTLHYDVIANSHRAHHLAACSEIAVVADRRTTHPTDIQ